MAATALDFILSQIQLREAPNNLPPNFQENNNRQLFALFAPTGPMSGPTTITIEGNVRCDALNNLGVRGADPQAVKNLCLTSDSPKS